MRPIAFRRLSIDDMQALFLWLLRPHVARWYAPAPSSFAEVVAKYGPRTREDSAVKAYVASIGGDDAGYVQTYAISGFPDYAQRLQAPPGAAGLDLFLGEERFVGWGLGSRVIRAFVDRVVFLREGVTECLAGPLEGNTACIRAFEKAGFAPWKVVANERGEPERLMRLARSAARYRIAPIDLERDLATCVAFRRAMYVESFGCHDGLEEEMGAADALYIAQLRERVAQIPEGNVHLWDGPRIVGQAEMRLRPDDDAGYVNLFYLVPECRGQGLGTLLHDHAVRVFRARGKRLVRLSVSARNVAAIDFYRRHGWRPIGGRPHRQPVELMELDLEAA